MVEKGFHFEVVPLKPEFDEEAVEIDDSIILEVSSELAGVQISLGMSIRYKMGVLLLLTG